ncbi:VPS53 [Auxenochlorella protothecoides x Auxenochlorella symbiontica]
MADTAVSSSPRELAQAPSEDPLDRPDFDVTAYVNRLFPTEESLSGLDPLVASLQHRISRVDAGILASVRQQSRVGGRARADLAAARADVAALCARVAAIRSQAAASEALVQHICRDIRRLDAAKRHLTATISSLRRLGMLMAALDALQAAVERGDYAEAGNLLEAVQALAAHFAAYAHVPRVAELRGRLGALEASARGRALREFEALGEALPPPATLERLRACCGLVAALGYQVRDELIDAVCRRETGVYTQIFGITGETARLERTVNRYKWLLKRLDARREVWAVFPPAWHVTQLLCVMFCNITKTALAEILDLKSGELESQVDALVKAVEATNIFEAEMARRFEPPPPAGGGGAERAPSPGPRARSEDDGMRDDAAPAREVRERYERAALERRAAAERGASPDRVAAREDAASAAVARTRFRGAISPVFAPYLGAYVAAVERDLAWGLDRMLAGESWEALAPGTPLLRSADELVEAVRGELRDCCARVGRGAVLRDLARAFARTYSAYAARLLARVPRVAGGGGSGGSTIAVARPGPPPTAVDGQAPGEAARLALILATAERCGEMVAQLARAVANRLEPPDLAAGLEAELEAGPGADFAALVAACHAALVAGVEARLDAALAAAARLDWAAMDGAGDQSEYVGTARGALLEAGAALGPVLPPNHLRFFADKLLAAFARRLADNVFRARRYSEMGSQQARLDVEVIKHAFVDMAREGGMESAALAAYAQAVGVELGRAQSVLKVVGAPREALVDTFFELMPDASPSEFQRIVDLKGLRRTELQSVLEEFNRRLGRAHFPAPTEEAAASASVPADNDGVLGIARRTITFGQLGAGERGGGATPGRTAQEMAARFKLNPNVQAARASAAAASDSMRETMGRTLGAMKSLRFMQREG